MFRALPPLVLALCLAASLHAQNGTDGPPADSADVLILDHDFTSTTEFVRVFLQEGQVYRGELSTPDLTLQIWPVIRNFQVPRIYPFLSTDTPSGMSIVEVYPQRDAEYEIRAVAYDGNRASTRLRLYRDIKASRRRELVRNKPGWEIGIELTGGWHSGFFQSNALPPLGSDPSSGSDINACFTARSAPGFRRLGWCVVGLGYQSQHGAKTILWIYTEPRLRLLGRSLPGLSNWELGALFRFGLGMISASSDSPVMLAPGAYLARQIRTNPHGDGWSVQASYIRASYRGFSHPFGAPTGPNPKSNRIELGLGWYH
jgi:hypothetical protein